MVAQAADPAGCWLPVITPVYPLRPKKIHDPNVVEGAAGQRWPGNHLGYRAEVIAGWCSLPASPLEELEQALVRAQAAST